MCLGLPTTGYMVEVAHARKQYCCGSGSIAQGAVLSMQSFRRALALRGCISADYSTRNAGHMPSRVKC